MTLGAQSTQFCSSCAFRLPVCIHLFLIFHSYGGPESQKVNLEYKRDWHDYLVCTLQYVVVVVDGRGTGYKGRRLRNPVRNNLGFWETRDQINAARCVFCASFLLPAQVVPSIWAGKDYVDPKRIGIWGWVRAPAL